MKNRPGFLVVLALFTLAAANAAAAGESNSKGQISTSPETQDEGEEGVVLTGLDFSYWAGTKGKSYGPGLTWGLILMPRMLEMGVTLGAMLGDKVYTIPVELRFSVPFALTRWLDLYLIAGPTLMFDRIDRTWKHDIAASAGGGLELKPPGTEWGLRLQGDYNMRLVQKVAHQGGFTVGFLYRF